MRQNGFAAIIITLLLLLVIGASGAFYYLTQVKNKQPEIIDSQKQTTEPRVTNNQPTSFPVSTNSAIQGQQKKFQSSQYRFSLFYPADWSYKENDPYVPNLAEYTVTFSSPDQNTGLDVWIKDGNWEDVKKDVLKDKTATTGSLAGQPAIIQPQGRGSITFVKHPLLGTKVIVFASIGENLTIADQIQKTLKFE